MEGYKFLQVENPYSGTIYLALVKLEIPDDAKVVYPIDKDYYCDSSFSAKDFYKMDDYVKAKKCRCSKAKIVEVIRYFSVEPRGYLLNGITCNLQPSDLIFKSLWNPNFIYKFNEYAKPDNLDEDILWECSNGIHFCRTIGNAIYYIETCGYTIIN